MNSLLAVVKRSKGKHLSLSCSDLPKALEYDESDFQRLRTQPKNCKSLPRFLRPRSAGSMDRTKRRSSSEFMDTFDCQLAEIKAKLAMFRDQDTEFRGRMESLSNSIGELASLSRSSLNLSEVSVDLMTSDDEEQGCVGKNDHPIEIEFHSMSRRSSSSEVLYCIPTIEITYCKRGSSYSSVHESLGAFTKTAIDPNRLHVYLYKDGDQYRTFL